MIEVSKLKAGYGDRIILENVSFSVREGEILAIVGRSGSGKSTLLKILIGLLQPMRGELWIEGKNLITMEGKERRDLLRSFGVLYQSGALFGSMTVLENVRLPLEEFTDLPEIALDLVALSKLRLVGLANAAGAMPAELSGGMQKRAALARALALDPHILFLDEPSGGLDPVMSAGLDELIREHAQTLGITVVLVTHELSSIERIATRVLMVDDEERGIIAEGTPGELRAHASDERVRSFFHPQSARGDPIKETPTR